MEIMHAYALLSIYLYSTGHWIGGTVCVGFIVLFVVMNALDDSPSARIARMLRR